MRIFRWGTRWWRTCSIFSLTGNYSSQDWSHLCICYMCICLKSYMYLHRLLWFSKHMKICLSPLCQVCLFYQSVDKFNCRVDLHANAYQHKTVKMFDLVSMLHINCLPSDRVSLLLQKMSFEELSNTDLTFPDVHRHVGSGWPSHPCHGNKGVQQTKAQNLI